MIALKELRIILHHINNNLNINQKRPSQKVLKVKVIKQFNLFFRENHTIRLVTAFCLHKLKCCIKIGYYSFKIFAAVYWLKLIYQLILHNNASKVDQICKMRAIYMYSALWPGHGNQLRSIHLCLESIRLV